MPLVCLLGRHGSGKSTIGAGLTEYGWTHLSVGLLRRLAQSGQFPSDVPPALIVAMRRERAGTPLSPLTAKRLVEHACAVPNMVLDGFPSSLEHLALLPPDTLFCIVWTPRLQRDARLQDRAATTKRQWTPGLPSVREAALSTVIRAARKTGRCLFLRNAGDIDAATSSALRRLSAGRVALG